MQPAEAFDLLRMASAHVPRVHERSTSRTLPSRHGSVELGDTRSHTLHWMLSLQAMGAPDFSVSGDTPLHAVFRRPDGQKTYLAFNASAAPLMVRFSDGQVLTVAPGSLARAN